MGLFYSFYLCRRRRRPGHVQLGDGDDLGDRVSRRHEKDEKPKQFSGRGGVRKNGVTETLEQRQALDADHYPFLTKN